MATHLLDTSALLAHYFDEPGAAEVESLWQESKNRIAICVLTLPEFRSRLRQEIKDHEEVDQAYSLYVDSLTSQIAIDRSVAETAAEIRDATKTRLPLIDAVIAGCARQASAILVHRDPHMDTIPKEIVTQLRLPNKNPDR